MPEPVDAVRLYPDREAWGVYPADDYQLWRRFNQESANPRRAAIVLTD